MHAFPGATIFPSQILVHNGVVCGMPGFFLVVMINIAKILNYFQCSLYKLFLQVLVFELAHPCHFQDS